MLDFLDQIVDFAASLDARSAVYFFWGFFLLDLPRYVILDLLILFWFIPQRRRQRPQRRKARQTLYREMPLVSVIAPGKNEGQHLRQLVKSIERQTYSNLELIVVDDGSDDDTPMIARDLYQAGKIQQWFRCEVRGGKASAANVALLLAKGEYIVHLDADSELRHDAIERILIPFFQYSGVGAVGGDLRVANEVDSIATRMQTLEYMKSISVGRSVSGSLGILRIVAGAFGAFPRSLLLRLRGWDVGPGLDGDITQKIRKLGYRIVHEPTAVCYTNVPTRFTQLARQRNRWDRSLIRFRLRKHRDVLLPSAIFRMGNFISTMENLLFTLGLNIKWWVYMGHMIVLHLPQLPLILVLNYILYLLAGSIEYLIACGLHGRTLSRGEKTSAAYLPLVPLYMGVYLRLIRSYANLMEFFHRSSYSDAWNPGKVSSVVKVADQHQAG